MADSRRSVAGAVGVRDEGSRGENARAWGFRICGNDVGGVGDGIVGYFPRSGVGVE